MPDASELLVVGSIALDTREGPYGKVREELGGSAVYFALAASLIMPVRLCAPVGRDGEWRVRHALAGRPVDTEGMDVLDAPTYRWNARQEHGRNLDLGSSDEIYDAWHPRLPDGFSGWAFVGSMRPDRQAEAMRAMHHSASLLAADAMLSYVLSRPRDANDVLGRASWFFCNEEEFAALGGGSHAEEFRRRWWLDGLVLKSGARGITAQTPDGRIHVPALPGHPAFDTTGAGDAVAGGMLARWLSTGGQRNGLRDALVCGVACASLTIEAIGVRGIATATPALLEQRMAEVWECMRRES